MTPFKLHQGIAAPLIRINVDTDAIIPSREMRSTGKTGLADGLFAGWRYTDAGARSPNPDFVLNQPRYAGASILLSGANFGCGSSREHAVWALAEYGFRCIIAPSFGAIFQNNCIRNGLLPLPLAAEQIEALCAALEAHSQPQLRVDLKQQCVGLADGPSFDFAIDPAARQMLLQGLDAIGLTLQSAANIQNFVQTDRQRRPWAYPQHG